MRLGVASFTSKVPNSKASWPPIDPTKALIIGRLDVSLLSQRLSTSELSVVRILRNHSHGQCDPLRPYSRGQATA
ncbi:hypothetical protein CGRA01v4_12389 [Colletotrichum graminicola]|nr:hypothetical protein CGRA01v4_12389 [Colletotrichum graminicola]